MEQAVKDRWYGDMTRGHRYRPASRSRIGQMVDEVHVDAGEVLLPARIRRWIRASTVAEIPELVERLTTAQIRSVLQERFDHYAAIASDPQMLHEWARPGRHQMLVQHLRSGLRAEFRFWDESLFGDVSSKPYNLPSIAEHDRGKRAEEWEDFVGMGIGTGIYLHAASLADAEAGGTVRWISGASSDHSEALRRKLHLRDPYRWEGHRCQWCESHSIYWSEASPSDYEAHPRSHGDC